MITLAPFKAIDWYVDEPLEYIENPGDLPERFEKEGVAISAYTEDGCVGCGGFIFWDKDNAEAWVRISKHGFKCRKEGIRVIKKMFASLMNNCPAGINMFCWVADDWPEAQRMVKWLGFTKSKESKTINDKKYFIWDITHGNVNDDSRDGSIRGRCYATECDDKTASGSTGLDQ